MNGIAVFFPGIGYHCDKPLLYFSRELAKETGYQELVNVSYAYHGGDIRGNPEKMRAAGLALFAQTEDALKEIRWDAYDDILFVSKSVGTAIAAAYARTRNIVVALTFDEHPRNGIAFTGTADPWVETETVVSGCAKAGLSLTVIEGANHSLETENPMRNLDILKEVMEKTRRFIRLETV